MQDRSVGITVIGNLMELYFLNFFPFGDNYEMG